MCGPLFVAFAVFLAQFHFSSDPTKRNTRDCNGLFKTKESWRNWCVISAGRVDSYGSSGIQQSGPGKLQQRLAAIFAPQPAYTQVGPGGTIQPLQRLQFNSAQKYRYVEFALLVVFLLSVLTPWRNTLMLLSPWPLLFFFVIVRPWLFAYVLLCRYMCYA